MKNTLLKGHALRREGMAFMDPHCGRIDCERFRAHNRTDDRAAVMEGRMGHALCECGAKSAHLMSTNQRKAWHRAHKDELRG